MGASRSRALGTFARLAARNVLRNRSRSALTFGAIFFTVLGLFAAIQVGMYVICLLKISEIARQGVPAATKLRLMENEENLFDGGLYIGIAGTATALVLQVIGWIDANLLAAYSSNLFGIVCVALVKIRHVRPYKRKLILESVQPVAA